MIQGWPAASPGREAGKPETQASARSRPHTIAVVCALVLIVVATILSASAVSIMTGIYIDMNIEGGLPIATSVFVGIGPTGMGIAGTVVFLGTIWSATWRRRRLALTASGALLCVYVVFLLLGMSSLYMPLLST